MKSNIGASKIGRKYAGPETMPTMPTGPANYCSTPTGSVLFLTAISKPIGRKQLCYKLHISRHLFDMWLSGERKNPIARVEEIIAAAAEYGPDLPLDIVQYLATPHGGLVSLVRKPKE
jgi:hypothetical protein